MKFRLIVWTALLVAACGPSAEDHPAGATPYTADEKALIARNAGRVESQGNEHRADMVMACGLALLEADRKGLVGSEAVVPPPWQVTSSPVDGGERVSCEGSDQRGPLTVVVDLRCNDVNDSRCHPLVRIERP